MSNCTQCGIEEKTLDRMTVCEENGSKNMSLTPSPVMPVIRPRNEFGFVDLGTGVRMDFVWCPPGSFMMGSPEHEAGRDTDEVLHRVTLSKGFWLGHFLVTLEQWCVVMGKDDLAAKIHRPENDTGRIHMNCRPDEFVPYSLAYRIEKEIEKESRLRQFKIWQAESDAKREQMLKRLTLSDHQPMFNVNMYDCLSFCKKLNSFRNGHSFRLPTEAEWEYACRAGTEGPFAGNLEEMGWFCDNSNGSTHIVGQKAPNKWGLYDMHGNVWEWCADGWDTYTIPKFALFIPRKVVDPVKPKITGDDGVYRGGSWGSSARACRSAHRGHDAASYAFTFVGFRVAADSI